MSRKLTLLTILTLALCASASADILYSTLGPNGEYDSQSGYFVDGSGYHNQVIAMPFTPDQTTTVTDAVLALSNFAGGNDPISLYMYSDNSNQPGTQLATLTQQGEIQSYFTGGSLVQFNCNGCGKVTAGTQYWLVAWEPDPGTEQAWMFSYHDQTGYYAYNQIGSIDGPWTVDFQKWSGFEVEGIHTPEPSSLLLLGSGLISAVAGLRRKLSR